MHKLIKVMTAGAMALCCLAAVQADVKVAYFPPLPDSWTIEMMGKTVIYKSPVVPDVQPEPATVIRMTYTRSTHGRDARGVMLDYVKQNNCNKPKVHGKGFYTTTCRTLGTDTVVVGEPNNVYTIEITGEYSEVSMDLINRYLNNIIKGKRTFEDREIGERIYDKNAKNNPAD